MSTKVIFLMGAPTSRSLQWDEEQLLSAPIAPFHGLDILPEGDWPFPDTQPVKWRLLQDLGAPTLQPEIYEWKPSADARFLTTWDLAGSKMISDTSALSQFYDHSFTVHETSEISTPGVYPGDSMQGSGLWTDSAGTSFATSSEKDGLTPGFPIQGPLTDLRDIPTAAYLTSIVPQTMTVNLIVAVLTVNAPRRVVTRQWRREFDLIEVVVGDDTRSGFGVTFWLPVADHEDKDGDCDGDGDALGKTLASLRPRDIVLMRMVGLGSFRERVYGQSLRKGITKVDLLHRQRVDVTDAGGLYSAKRLREMQQQMQQDPGAKSDDDVPMLKASKVREWIRRWAPDAAGGEGGRGGLARGPAGNSSSGGLHRLPPDTQE